MRIYIIIYISIYVCIYIYLNLFSSNGNDARVASNVTSAQKIVMLKYEILSSFFQFFFSYYFVWFPLLFLPFLRFTLFDYYLYVILSYSV